MNFDDIFRFNATTNLIYGLGSSAQAGNEAKRLGITRVLLVTDKGVMASGILSAALESLQAVGIPVTAFDEAPQDPTDQTVDQVAEFLRSKRCDGVLVAGGGSALCTGKGAALMAANEGRTLEFVGANKYGRPPLPCIAIPTTAGSGSEVSRITVLTDALTKRKITVAGLTNAPSSAILDPLLLRTVPFRQALASGIDAYTHAVEAYVARFASPFTDALALSAARLVAGNIGRAILSNDLEAQSQMLYASSMANLACGNAGLGLAHAMNGAITYLSKAKNHPHVPYGLIHAIALPLVLEFNAPACDGKLAELALATGFGEPGSSRSSLVRRFVDGTKGLFSSLGAPSRLPWENASSQDIREMAEITLDSGQAQQNPRKSGGHDLITLFERAIKGWE